MTLLMPQTHKHTHNADKNLMCLLLLVAGGNHFKHEYRALTLVHTAYCLMLTMQASSTSLISGIWSELRFALLLHLRSHQYACALPSIQYVCQQTSQQQIIMLEAEIRTFFSPVRNVETPGVPAQRQ